MKNFKQKIINKHIVYQIGNFNLFPIEINVLNGVDKMIVFPKNEVSNQYYYSKFKENGKLLFDSNLELNNVFVITGFIGTKTYQFIEQNQIDLLNTYVDELKQIFKYSLVLGTQSKKDSETIILANYLTYLSIQKDIPIYSWALNNDDCIFNKFMEDQMRFIDFYIDHINILKKEEL